MTIPDVYVLCHTLQSLEAPEWPSKVEECMACGVPVWISDRTRKFTVAPAVCKSCAELLLGEPN